LKDSILSRFLKFWTEGFPWWVIIGSVIALFQPDLFIPLKKQLSFYFAITMFGIGMTLEIEDFKKILKSPVIIFQGTLLQYSVMPLSSFIFAVIFQLPPDFALGLILAGSAPGAMSSNVMTYLVRGDVAYSVSLTTVSTILAPLLTPSLTYLLANTFIKVDFWGLFFSIIKTVIIPLAIGIYLRYRFAELAKKALEVFPALSVLAIVIICAVVVALNQSRILKVSIVLFWAVLMLNGVGYLGGYYGGRFMGLELRRCRTLSIEIGMQNAGLGMVLALKHFSEGVALPSALFCIWCIITTSFMVKVWNVQNKSK
jgi:BASS family bile acid:Na+ symporter